MSERGFIAVDRGLFDHPIFTDEPMSEREAWIWLIANAVWAPQQKRVGSQVLDLQRGQIGCSLRFLAKAWKWSDSRVRRFLGKLQAAQMIDAVATHMATQITVCNYDTYQASRRSSDAPSDAVPTQTITRKQKTTSSEPNGSSVQSSASAKPSPRNELVGTIDAEHADQLLEHRRRMGAPLTASAAAKLAAKLAKWPDPNEAVDEMLANGWQGFEAKWLESRRGSLRVVAGSRPQPPPKPKSVGHRMADLMLGKTTTPQNDDEDWRTINGHASRY